MQVLCDMVGERPDEYDLMAVRTDGRVWERLGTYGTRQEAEDEAFSLDRARYRAAAIKPQISHCRPFQTHAMYELWRTA